jgi:hypothetical protein
MLTKREIAEMKTLTERALKGSVSREDWSNLAALALMHMGEATVTSIAAQGLDEFITVSQPVYEGHAFQHDDYRRMYDRICIAARQYQKAILH